MTNKSGWRTSEFWITVFMVLGLVVSSAAASLNERWAAVGAGISVAAYSISRGLAKLFPQAVVIDEKDKT